MTDSDNDQEPVHDVIFDESESIDERVDYEESTSKYEFYNMMICHCIITGDTVGYNKNRDLLLELITEQGEFSDTLLCKETYEQFSAIELREKPLKPSLKDFMVQAFKTAVCLRKNRIGVDILEFSDEGNISVSITDKEVDCLIYNKAYKLI